MQPFDGARQKSRPQQGQAGYTLMETIVVMVILAILTVVALVRIPALDEHTRQIEINTLKSHLRYVQARAMGSESAWSLRFTAADTYRFLKDGANSSLVPPGADITDAKLNPDNDSLTVNLVGLRVDTDLGGSLTDRINFDKNGSPVLDDGTTALTSDITLKDTDGDTLFDITAYTGFIE